MAAKIIRFFPKHFRKEAKTSTQEKLVNAAWKFAHCALWAEQSFTREEEDATKAYIREYFAAATDGKRAFTALIQRIILTQKYLLRSADRYLPQPSVWFNRACPHGFAGTLAWLSRVEQQRRQVPGYLAHVEALAQGYYSYTGSPDAAHFNRCREKLLQLRTPGLLQLFYNTIIYTNYLSA